jgi:hypothetical protein
MFISALCIRLSIINYYRIYYADILQTLLSYSFATVYCDGTQTALRKLQLVTYEYKAAVIATLFQNVRHT